MWRGIHAIPTYRKHCIVEDEEDDNVDDDYYAACVIVCVNGV